jgi:P4 family phage/plasmid primase-like protien
VNFLPGMIYEIARSFGLDIPDDKEKVQIRCPLPGHDDHRPSAVLFRATNSFFCHVCTPTKGIGAKEFAERLSVPWDGAFRTAAARASTPDMRSPPAFTISDVERLWPMFKARGDADEFDPSDEPVKRYAASRGLEQVFAAGLAGIVGVMDELPRSIYRWPERGYRLVVPLFNLSGELRSMQARAISDADPKVRLPPKAPAKGVVFANAVALEMLKAPASKTPKTVLFCEGLTDHLAASLATDLRVLGIPGCSFASNAFGEWTRGANVVLAMDNDSAGLEATRYAARAAYVHGARSVRRLEHPEGAKDLCDIVAKYGMAELRSFLAQYVEGAEGATSVIGGGVSEVPREKPKGAAATKSKSQTAPEAETGSSQEAQPAAEGLPVHALTDTGNAERFCQLAAGDFKFCVPWGKWLVWDGCRWEEDQSERAMALSKDVPRLILEELSALDAGGKEADGDDEDGGGNSHLAWAVASQSHGKRKALVALAQCEPGIPVQPSQFDSDPWLLNCCNGTIDLRDGTLHPHRRGNFITKLARCDFDPDAKAPTWLRFLEQVLPDPEVRGFLQRLVGYSLTGSQAEQIMTFLIGDGANGKSTFLTAIQNAIGSAYCIQVSSEILLQRNQRGHPTELADLCGVRIAICVETGQNAALDEVLVKGLTGGDIIRARRMREDFWQFSPTHHVWVASNHRPVIRGSDHAIWRRMVVIPFEITIPRSQQDKSLPTKLQAEAPGILAWAVQGCREWQADGLRIPDAVRGHVESYRHEMDVMAQFFEDRCELDVTSRVGATALYRAYAKWSEAHGELVLSQTQFGSELRRRNIQRGKSSGLRMYFGIRFKSDTAPAPDQGQQGYQGGFSTLSPHARDDSECATQGNTGEPPYCPCPSSMAGLERGESGLMRLPEGIGDCAERSTRSISTATEPSEEVDPLGADEREV